MAVSRLALRSALVVMLFGVAAGAVLAAEPKQSPQQDERAERLREMREVVRGIQATTASGNDRIQVEVVPQPILRFGDAARNYEDGTVWIWGRSGRPIATLELYRNAGSGHYWVLALSCLSSGQVQLRGRTGWAWTPSGVDAKATAVVPSGPPASDKVVRLRQMKQIARRFRAHEFWDPDNQRFELRLLARPVHRYEDAKAGLLDGALFLFCHGTNPEVVLLVEAVEAASSPLGWHYTLARSGHAEMHVSLDDREVWQCLRVAATRPSDPYHLLTEPVRGPTQ